MTQEFDSPALDLINNAYGLSGIDAEQQTFLEDGSVQQLLSIDSIARRSRAPFTRGIFSIRLVNSHAVLGSLESFADPYNPVNVHNGYPASVDPRKAEIWLLSATALSNVGGSAVQAMIGVDSRGVLQGVSDTAAGGGSAPSNFRDFWGFWDDFSLTDSLGIEYGQNSVSGKMTLAFPRRLSAGEPLLFRSESIGMSEIACRAICFIGPVALGQDLF